MNKQDLLKIIIGELHAQLDVLAHCAHDAELESKQETDVAPSQVDHRALEASLLAKVQGERVKEAQDTIEVFKQFPIKLFKKQDPIQPSALVELEHLGENPIFIS